MLALGVPPSTVVMAPVPPTVMNTSALWVRGARRRTGSRRPRRASQTSYPSRTSPASTMPPRSTAPCTSRPRSTPRRPTRRTRFSPRPGSSSAAPPSGRSPPAGSHSRSSRCCWPSLRRRIQTPGALVCTSCGIIQDDGGAEYVHQSTFNDSGASVRNNSDSAYRDQRPASRERRGKGRAGEGRREGAGGRDAWGATLHIH